MKKTRRLLLLLSMSLMLLSGCVSRPPASLILSEPDDAAMLISADPGDAAQSAQRACLYYRFGNTEYLAAEERILTVPRDQSMETAIVEALILGPSATLSSLTPLFPAGTRVLAASRQKDTLFITFNEALLSEAPEGSGEGGGAGQADEGRLHRRLCMDALAATLTQAGLCTQVQVLIYPEKVQSSSMRLTEGYFTFDAQDDAIAAPLTRREEAILTPHNAAKMLLDGWMRQDWAALYAMTCQQNRPAEAEVLNLFALSPALTGFRLSHGDVTADGQTALLNAEITLQSGGQDQTIENYPLMLLREGGLWKMPYEQLKRMMNQE